MRVLVAEGHRDTRNALCEALARLGFAVYAAEDGARAVQSIASLQPDAVALSIELPMRDGLGVLADLARLPMRRYPYMAVLSAMGPDPLAHALSLGADMALAKPVSADTLAGLFGSSAAVMETRLARAHAIKRLPLVERQLAEIGMPKNLKGFQYLMEAVARVSADDRLIWQATLCLYPRIAETYGVSSHSVERAIRHAIETTWTHGRVDALHRVFGNSIDPQRGKPTNVECIALLVQQLFERKMVEA